MPSLAMVTFSWSLYIVCSIMQAQEAPFFSLKGLLAEGILLAAFRGPSLQHMRTLITSSQLGLLSSQGHMVRSQWLKGLRENIGFQSKGEKAHQMQVHRN